VQRYEDQHGQLKLNNEQAANGADVELGWCGHAAN